VRTLRARVRSTTVGYAAPESAKITIHRSQWSVDQATQRAAKLAVRMIRRASAGVEWPNTRVFADFSEETVRRHFQKHFAKIIRRERAAART
jgi:hypothetical protein